VVSGVNDGDQNLEDECLRMWREGGNLEFARSVSRGFESVDYCSSRSKPNMAKAT
jgi:hypothetical protein